MTNHNAALDITADITADAALVKTANDRLAKTAAMTDLDALVAATSRRSILLVDASGSMDENILKTGERKIDALRKVVRDLRETNPVPVAAFGCYGGIQLIDVVPEPEGSTPMGQAIRFAKEQGANHIVIVSDGVPDSERDAFNAAVDFKGPIDTFYIGDGNDNGARFSKRLSKMTGGVAHLTDLSAPKELGSKLRGLLGDGSSAL